MSHLRNAREPPWNVDPLVRLALAKPLVCAPGTCFSYAHTNFVLLAEVLQKAAGQTVARLIRSRVLVPLGLCNTDSPSTPAIRPPVLHVYATDGGPYEDSTYWNESWTAAPGSVMTTNIYDLASSGNAIGNLYYGLGPRRQPFLDRPEPVLRRVRRCHGISPLQAHHARRYDDRR